MVWTVLRMVAAGVGRAPRLRRWLAPLAEQRGAASAEYALAYSGNLRILAHRRCVDELGRVVLPAESRVRLGLGEGSTVEIVDVPEGLLIRPLRGKAQP